MESPNNVMTGVHTVCLIIIMQSYRKIRYHYAIIQNFTVSRSNEINHSIKKIIQKYKISKAIIQSVTVIISIHTKCYNISKNVHSFT